MQKTQTSSSSFMMKNDNSHPAIWRQIPLKVSSALSLYLFNQLSKWCVLCKIPVRIAVFTQDIFQNLQNNYYREFLDLFSFLSLLSNTWQNKPRRSFCHCLKGSSQQWWDGMAARSSYGLEWVTYISTEEGQKVGPGRQPQALFPIGTSLSARPQFPKVSIEAPPAEWSVQTCVLERDVSHSNGNLTSIGTSVCWGIT